MKTRTDLIKYEMMYDTFDKGHDRRHLNEVRDFSVLLAKIYCPDRIEIAYVAATLHDVGISIGRKGHEIEGESLVKNDKELTGSYNDDELKDIYESIREHRASTGNPQSIVAKIISDADKVSAGTNRVFQRAFEWGVENVSSVNHDGQLLRAAYHLKDKFGGNGTGNRLYFEESKERQAKTYSPIIEALDREYDFETLNSLLE